MGSEQGQQQRQGRSLDRTPIPPTAKAATAATPGGGSPEPPGTIATDAYGRPHGSSDPNVSPVQDRFTAPRVVPDEELPDELNPEVLQREVEAHNRARDAKRAAAAARHAAAEAEEAALTAAHGRQRRSPPKWRR